MAAGGGSGGAIKAGQAFVELLGKDSGLARALDRAQAKVKAFGQTVAQVGAGVTAGGAAVLAPITGLFSAVVERGVSLDNLARQLGTTVEEVSALGYAFESVGLKTEDFADVMKTLDQKISHALDGNDEAANTFRRLGLSFNQLSRMTPAERLDKVGGALSRIAIGSDKTEFAMKLLGGQGAKTLRIFEQGPGALQALMGKAGDVGAVMSTETAAAAVRVGKAFAEMWAAGKYALLSLGEALLPQAAAIEEFGRRVVSAAKVFRKWVAENREAILAGVALGAALAAGGAALVAFGLGLSVLATSAGGFVAGLVLIKGAVLAMLSPLGLALAAVAAIGAGWAYVLTQTAPGRGLTAFLTSELAGAWGTVAEAATGAWKGITSALARGDLKAAGEFAMAGLNVAVAQGWLSIRRIWSESVRYLADAWATTAAGMRLVFADASAAIQETFTRMIAGLLSAASGLARTIGKGGLAAELEDFASEARRSAGLDARLADRRRKEITDALLADVGRRAGEAGDALAGPRLALEEAKKRLADLLGSERGGGGWDFKIPDWLRKAIAKAVAAADPASRLAASAAGSFTGGAADLGLGKSVVQRQLGLQEDANKKLDAIEAAVKKLKGAFFG